MSSTCRAREQSTKYCCMRRSMNQPKRQAAAGSARASWRRVGIVVPTACVRNRCQLSNIAARSDSKPNRSSTTPAMFWRSRASSKKSCGIVKLYLEMLLMSLSESPVVVSVVFNCICMRLLACSLASRPPKPVVSIAWGPQQNRLNAPGLSVAPEVKDPVRIATHNPEGICTSNPFVCRKKWFIWFCTKATLLSDKISTKVSTGRVGTLPSGSTSEADKINCFVCGGKLSNTDRTGWGAAGVFAACCARRVDRFRMASSAPVAVPAAPPLPRILRAFTARWRRCVDCVHASILLLGAILLLTPKGVDSSAARRMFTAVLNNQRGTNEATSARREACPPSSSAEARLRISLMTCQQRTTGSDS